MNAVAQLDWSTEIVRTLPERIAQTLRDAIICGGLKPGEPLRHTELAQRLEVSYGPLREALRQLAGEGFVRFVPYHGAVVAPLLECELRDYIDMAIVLEGMAVREAAPRLTAADIERARAIHCEVLNTADTGQWLDMVLRIRLGLYAPCGRIRLLEQIRIIRLNAHRYSHVLFSTAEGRRLTLDVIGGLIDICATGDGEAAAEFVKASYTRGNAMIAEQLRARGTEVPRAAAPPAVAKTVEARPARSRVPGVRAVGATKTEHRPPRSRRRPSGV